MEDPNRFADTGDSLSDLATHFVVHCPKCDGRANVLPFEGSWRLTCEKCFHTEKPGHWYGTMTAYVSVKCRNCHQRIVRRAVADQRFTTLMVKCEHCGDECAYEATFSKSFIQDGLMVDPVFGLTLWLQASFRGNVFWAYHDEHLGLLEQYVRAKLRERGIHNKGSKNSLMFSRLPAFIKKAGNRKELLSLIKNLQIKK
jgi:hypothetical protein